MTRDTKSAEDQRVGGHLSPRRAAAKVEGLVERAFIELVSAWMAVYAAMLRRRKPGS
jgi:hypothetical protein